MLDAVAFFLGTRPAVVVDGNTQGNKFSFVAFKFSLIGFFDSLGVVFRKVILDLLP